MTVTQASMAVVFPEFANTTTYPPAQVEYWIGESANELNSRRLGKRYDLAVMLFTAHNLVLSRRDFVASVNGIPGASPGLVTSKTVDKVSVSYDATATAIDGAGAWNATSYGQRLYKLIQAASAGPLYVPGVQRQG